MRSLQLVHLDGFSRVTWTNLCSPSPMLAAWVPLISAAVGAGALTGSGAASGRVQGPPMSQGSLAASLAQAECATKLQFVHWAPGLRRPQRTFAQTPQRAGAWKVHACSSWPASPSSSDSVTGLSSIGGASDASLALSMRESNGESASCSCLFFSEADFPLAAMSVCCAVFCAAAVMVGTATMGLITSSACDTTVARVSTASSTFLSMLDMTPPEPFGMSLGTCTK
mmetsp:Transcript_1956/g.7044  ORF Transcript_1956/g.7044 Transcript_1956/m.7044 type:complete len:226 (+) Transcript_1956:1623-2300(+)